MRGHVSGVLLVLKCIGLIFLICFTSEAFAQNRYQITRLPTPQGASSVALGINNHGEVVGYSFLGDDYQAFLYSYADRSLTNVGSLGGKINAACAINDAGKVTGYSQDGNGNLMAFVFSRNQPIAPLGTSGNASMSEAFGINNTGAVVGDIQSGTQNHRPALFTNGSVQDLGLGVSNQPDALETAYAINDAGQIVGRHSAGPNAFHAFSFVNGNTTDFSTLGGANGEALAINKHGLVVGDSDTAGGSAHAFVFDHSQLKDLGTLPGYDTASFARGINNSGDIVGESDSADQKRAFLVTKGQLVELDKIAENLSEAGFTSLDVAYGINEKGWIVGYGTTTDNLTAGFIAVPEGHGIQGPTSDETQYRGQEQPVSDPADSVVGVKGTKDQVAGQGSPDSNFGGFLIPHLSDHDNIRIPSQNASKPSGEGEVSLWVDRNLDHSRELILHRVFHDYDAAFLGVQTRKESVKGGGFTGACRPSYRDNAVG
jgi:probable HAF family extracellular repeat protein